MALDLGLIATMSPAVACRCRALPRAPTRHTARILRRGAHVCRVLIGALHHTTRTVFCALLEPPC